MEEFIEEVFAFMQGNFLVLNVIILYGIPFVTAVIGGCLMSSFNKMVWRSIGAIILMMSVITCFWLAILAFMHLLIFTGIAGFIIAGAAAYLPFAEK
jgi:hypothetical protein